MHIQGGSPGGRGGAEEAPAAPSRVSRWWSDPLREALRRGWGAWQRFCHLPSLFFVIRWWFLPSLLTYCPVSRGLFSHPLYTKTLGWERMFLLQEVSGDINQPILPAQEEEVIILRSSPVPFNQIRGAFSLWLLTESFFRSKGLKMHCIQAPVF